MVHFRQVQRGITVEALDKLASEHGIIVARNRGASAEPCTPAFPALLIAANLKYPTNNVESVQFIGTGPILGFHLSMHADSERVYISVNVTGRHTLLAYKTARLLRKVGDKVETSLVESGFSGEYGLDELAAGSKQAI